MKLHQALGTLSVAVLLILIGISPVRAQYAAATQQAPAAEQTPKADDTPVPSKMTTRQELRALEEKNIELEYRLKTLEDKLMQGMGSNNMNTVGPDTVGSTGSQISGGFFEDETISNNREIITPFNLGNEYLNSDTRHFLITDPTGNLVFRIAILFEADFHAFFQPLGQYLLNDYDKEVGVPIPAQKDYNGFFARKAHLDFDGYFNKMFGASVGIEGDSSDSVSIGFHHAYLFAKFDKLLTVTAGKISDPMSLENVQPSETLPFLEPSMIADLIPAKDIGLMISGEFNHLGDYAIILYNGEQDNESSSTGPAKPEQNGKALTARVFLTPFLKTDDEWLKGLGFGMGWGIDNETNAYSIGGGDISPAQNTPWPGGLATSLGGNEFAYDGVSFFADGPFYHWDPQFYYFTGPIGLQGEYVQSIETVITPGALAPVQLTNTAWLLEAYFDLGGEPGYEGPKIDKPFNPSKGQWGDLEFVARVDQVIVDPKSYTVDQPYDNQQTPGTSLATGAGLATAFGIGANWWLNSNFKIMCDFERTEFSGGNYVNAAGQSTIPPEQVVFSRAAFLF